MGADKAIFSYSNFTTLLEEVSFLDEHIVVTLVVTFQS